MGGFSRVVVTGGAGFIGSCLVRRLLNRGYTVVVLDNFSSGSRENLKGLYDSSLLEVVEGDVRDKGVVRKVLRDCDAIVHLAALIDVEASVKNPYETHDVNVNGTLNVLSEAVRARVKRFVFASSTAVYGNANPLPLREDYVPRPISPYAASKAAAESYCLAFNHCYGIETVILRYFNVYGPGQRNSAYSSVITKFLENTLSNKSLVIYGDGNQTRDFIYVSDVVNATMLALEKDNVSGDIFNICTGKPTSVNDLVEIVRVIIGKNNLKVVYNKPRKGDIENNFGDPSKAEKKLGFKATISLNEGLKSTIKSFYDKL